MSKEDFINWLGRPVTTSDMDIINTLLEMIKTYDENVKLIEELMLKVNKLQKEKIKEEIEILEVD